MENKTGKYFKYTQLVRFYVPLGTRYW